MKILMITHKDGPNASLGKIAKAYLRRGHSVEIYAIYMEKSVLRFFDDDVEIHSFHELTKAKAEKFDLMFLSCVGSSFLENQWLFSLRIPIFTQKYLIDQQVIWGGDFSFVPSLETSITEYDEYMSYSRIAIGEPKYEIRQKNEQNSKRFLFIDSGHYPFGINAKRELAKTLISICTAFPDYELYVKPRFLPNDKIITHKNAVHLYDVIRDEAQECIPANLVLLDKHYDLDELIESACTVICMYTTAFSGVLAADKGLVVLENLPSDDVYDLRMKVLYRVRKFMENSGALIDYHDVLKLLPEGSRGTEEYRKQLLEETEDVADKICQVTEEICAEIRRGVISKYCVTTYKDYLRSHETEQIEWEQIISRRCKDYLMQRMLIHTDFHAKAAINVEYLLVKAGKRTEELMDEAKCKEILENANAYRSECIIQNQDLLWPDEVDRGILLNAMYLTERYDLIKKLPESDAGAYWYFRGMVYYKEKDMHKAIELLEKYMDITLQREYLKEVTDLFINKFNGFEALIRALLSVGKRERAKFYLKKVKEFYYECYLTEWTVNQIGSRDQGLHFTCVHWLDGEVNNRVEEEVLKNLEEKILVYGFGEICERYMLSNPNIAKRIVAIVDNFKDETKWNEIPVIRSSEVTKIPEVKMMVVCVPHVEKKIMREMEQIAPELKLCSISELF